MPATEELLSKLRGSDEEAREEAAAALVGVLDKKIVPELVRYATTDQNPGVKHFAKKALAAIQKEFGDLQRILDEMAGAETDTSGEKDQMDPQTRAEVERILKAVRDGDKVILEGMLEKLPFEGNPYIRATIISAIGRLGDQSNMDDVITFLSDEDFRVIANTVEALERLGNPKCLDHIIKLVSHSDNRVRANVVRAMWKLTSSNTKINSNISKAMRGMLLSDNQEMRESALFVLTSISDENTIELLSSVLKELPPGQFRDKAHEALEKILKINAERNNIPVDETYVSRIIDNLSKSAQAEMSKNLDDAARKEIERIQEAIDSNSREKCPQFVTRLSTEANPFIKATLISAIGKLGDRGDMDAIISYLKDSDSRIAANTVEALEKLGNPKCVESIVKVISHSDNRVRANAVKAVWSFAHSNVVARRVVMERLKEMMFSTKTEMRESAIFVLGEIADGEAMDLLSIAATDKNPAVKEKAAEAMARAQKIMAEREAQERDEPAPVRPSKKPDPMAGHAQPKPAAPPEPVRAKEEPAPVEQPRAAAEPVEPPAMKPAPAPRAAEPPKKEHEAPPAVPKVEKSFDEALQTLAVAPDAQILDDQARAVIDEIQDAVSNTDRTKLPEYCERVGNEKNPFIRATLAAAIGRLGGRNDMDALLPLIEDADTRVAANAVEALENLGNSKCVESLIKIISHPDNRVRANVVKAIWKFAHTNVMAGKLIMNRLKEMMFSTKQQMRESAIFVLSEIANEEAVELITLGLNDKVPAIKEKAQEAIEKANRIIQERASAPAASESHKPAATAAAKHSDEPKKASATTAKPAAAASAAKPAAASRTTSPQPAVTAAPQPAAKARPELMPIIMPGAAGGAKRSSPLKTAFLLAFFMFIAGGGGGAYYWFVALEKNADDLVAFIRGENVFAPAKPSAIQTPVSSSAGESLPATPAAPPKPKEVLSSNDQLEIAKQYMNEGHFTEAINLLTTLSQKYPQNNDFKNALLDALYKRADAFFNLEIIDVAKAEFEKVADIGKNTGFAMKAQSRLDKISKLK